MQAVPLRGGHTESCRFVAPRPWRWLLLGSLLLTAGLLAYGAWSAHQGGGLPAAVEMGAGAFGVVVAWSALAYTGQHEVIVRGPLVTVARGRHVSTFDLDDPAVDVLVKDEAIGFAHAYEPWVAVHARDVDWPVFRALVLNRLDRTALRERARHRGFVA